MELLHGSFRDVQTMDVRNRVQSVLVTWELSFQFLEENYPQSIILLKYCSMLHWRNIPGFTIQLLPEFQGITDVRFRSVVVRLLHWSLISITQYGSKYIEISIHPLVHERISQRFSLEECKGYPTAVVGILATTIPYYLPGRSCNFAPSSSACSISDSKG